MLKKPQCEKFYVAILRYGGRAVNIGTLLHGPLRLIRLAEIQPTTGNPNKPYLSATPRHVTLPLRDAIRHVTYT